MTASSSTALSSRAEFDPRAGTMSAMFSRANTMLTGMDSGAESLADTLTWRADVKLPLRGVTTQIVKPPSPPAPSSSVSETARVDSEQQPEISELLAEWHGQVISIEQRAFRAQLVGTHGLGVIGKQEEALIPIDDVSDDDAGLFVEGAFFRLCVSYETDRRGVRRRCTSVVFRRMPAFRREELEEARRAGQEIARGLRLE